MKVKNESILDQPQPDLDKSVWDNKDGVYFLKEDAKNKIRCIVNWTTEKFNIVNVTVNITGSITSNSYSDDSDIDVHMHSPMITEENQEQMNKELRAAYETEFKGSKDGKDKIGIHPIEVYFQWNPFQDMMSVGCYDFNSSKWIVGPDIKTQEYDPYGDFYDDDVEFLEGIIHDVRQVISKAYEYIIVLKGSKDEKFQASICQKFVYALKEAQELFDAARKNRTAMSSPDSLESALKLRQSRHWKIADSAFKLMDEFGYLATLKKMKTAYEELQNDPNKISDVVKDLYMYFAECDDGSPIVLKEEDNIQLNPKDKDAVKILFLDFDGVLRPFDKKDDGSDYYPWGYMIKVVKRICDETNSKIVWSTSWKNFGKDEKRTFGTIECESPMKKLYEVFNGYICEDDPETPVIKIEKDPEKKIYPTMSKVPEIKQWLERHLEDISNFAIVDDVDYMSGGLKYHYGDHYFKTKSSEGLTDYEANKIIEFFGGEVPHEEIDESDNILYICLKLDEKSQNTLKQVLSENLKSKYDNIYCDHLTLAYGNQVDTFDMNKIGQEVQLESSEIAYDDKCAALVINKESVSDIGVNNDNPHITMATVNGTKPVYSNTLLAGNHEKITLETPIRLTTKVQAVYKK